MRSALKSLLAVLVAVSPLTADAHASASSKADTRVSEKCGHASWYALTSRTASGERMNPKLLTAAHRTYKFGTMLRVVNKNNGKSVIVRVNDRGPFVRGRMIDISRAAAEQIGLRNAGVGHVCTEVVATAK
jgi:rare lipoprotein A